MLSHRAPLPCPSSPCATAVCSCAVPCSCVVVPMPCANPCMCLGPRSCAHSCVCPMPVLCPAKPNAVVPPMSHSIPRVHTVRVVLPWVLCFCSVVLVSWQLPPPCLALCAVVFAGSWCIGPVGCLCSRRPPFPCADPWSRPGRRLVGLCVFSFLVSRSFWVVRGSSVLLLRRRVARSSSTALWLSPAVPSVAILADMLSRKSRRAEYPRTGGPMHCPPHEQRGMPHGYAFVPCRLALPPPDAIAPAAQLNNTIARHSAHWPRGHVAHTLYFTTNCLGLRNLLVLGQRLADPRRHQWWSAWACYCRPEIVSGPAFGELVLFRCHLA